ncbi:DNA polymerase III subunit delta [Pelobacter propionicus]|uniref:DNA polymerase III subunit delta n=1 Tax=Pelobacter propionicus (strain DSM 2379 / NBRC 103807 / OttBd1) TaxID=338966 RepID=A1APS5_PELPD|nr:DNA polymerase III subunit delta [Pelobacter propionicus]ABK99345.1 DNA polymerase III, delta subunit [Pelobacter propionicus DSM 2379]
MTPQELETSIRGGRLPLLCYLYGEESFLIERATRLLLEKAVDPSLKDFNFNVFFGNESRGIDIVDAALTLPMFAERRAVLVKRAELLKVDALEVLLEYLRNPATGTCLVFNGLKIDQRKKFFQELKKQGALVEYKRLYENKLSAFILGEAKTQGKPMEPAAADLLSFLIGNNLQELSSQIEKLVLYAGDRPRITLDDVREVASSSKAFTVFELARYLGIRDLSSALKSLDTLFRNGEEVPMMLGALARHFRQLWRVRELLDQGVPQSDIGRQVGINPYFLGEYLQQARNFPRPELSSIFEELYRCDLASKSGGHPYTLMHGLVTGICGGSVGQAVDGG